MTNRITDLPENLPSNELKSEFIKVIDSDKQVVEKLDHIKELAEKQWHNYELIDNHLRGIITEWMQRNLDLESPLMVDDALNIVSYLGLSQIYEWLKRSKIGSNEVRKLVDEATKEFGEDVSNPYAGI